MSRFAIVLFVAATCTACLRSTTVISLKPDGSGTIVQETGISAQAMEMIKGMAAGAGEKEAAASKELFGEAEARKAAGRWECSSSGASRSRASFKATARGLRLRTSARFACV
jgi:hypothetical protein